MIRIETDIGDLWFRDLAEDTIGVTRMVDFFHTWAPAESDFVRENFKGGVFVDVGAHVGWFSVLAAQQGASRVIAIEPAPANIELLRLNTQDYPAVEVVEAAAWDSVESLPLYISACNTGDNRTYGAGGFVGASGECIQVSGMPVDQLVSHADFVKIDTQGSDRRVVMGMKALIAAEHPTIMLEFSPDHIRSIGDGTYATLDYYISLGYTVKTVPENSKISFDGYDDCTLALTRPPGQ